ncbi:DUF305 domain-containing protein [Arthrobacter sp. SF27]|nr:DUF305 domain-containing protein [Arthrobacter sp. SF27]
MKMGYWRFGAMIATATVVMYGLMFIDTYALDHLRWSESRMYMAITMGGVMALIMLGWMLNMYRNRKMNIAIVAVSLLVLATSISLDRSQATIDDTAFMNSMIPHHSMAILRSERAGIEDYRVCELAVAISEAQRREISEMEWLVNDIAENGPAETAAEAESRPVPEYEVSALRHCQGISSALSLPELATGSRLR